MSVKTYRYSQKIQLSPHFNTSEFRCKCGENHDIKIDSDLIEKLEKLYEKSGCSKIIITSVFRFFYTYFDLKKAVFSGIDVSEHQGFIDWKTAKNEIDFAILRAGYGKEISQIDKYFEKNYLSCRANKIPVGVYWYSYTTTVEDAKKKAEICLKILKNKQSEYPVFFDPDGKTELDTCKNNCSEMVKIFCDTLEKAGYFAGLYISRSHLQTHIDDEIKSKYALWVAEYDTEKLNYNGSVGIWQKACKGCIPGISGDVDIDICYEDYPEIIKSARLNGFSEIAKNSVDVTVNINGKNYSGTLSEE